MRLDDETVDKIATGVALGGVIGIVILMVMIFAMLLSGCATVNPSVPYTTEHTVGPIPWNWASGGSDISVGPIGHSMNVHVDPLKVVTVHNPFEYDINAYVACDSDTSVENSRTIKVGAKSETRYLVNVAPQNVIGEVCSVVGFDFVEEQ